MMGPNLRNYSLKQINNIYTYIFYIYMSVSLFAPSRGQPLCFYLCSVNYCFERLQANYIIEIIMSNNYKNYYKFLYLTTCKKDY